MATTKKHDEKPHDEKAKEPKLAPNGNVVMTRDGAATDVHPDSVETMEALGWKVAS